MDVEKTPAPTCTCPSGDGSLRWPCPIHAAVAAINLHEERIGFVLMPLSPAAVAPHVAEYIIGFDFDEVRDAYGERFAVFWQGLVAMFRGHHCAPAVFVATGNQQAGEVQGDARAQFEAWHCEKFKTRWQTGAPTRDMHNGIYADNYGPAEQQERWELWQAAVAASQPGAQYCAANGKQQGGGAHPDDLAVDAFAAAMRAKMADARAKGRSGWEDPAQCSAETLSKMLRDHVEKGDPRDVANFCMMLHQRGAAIVPQAMQVPDNQIVRKILGRPNFGCIELAGMLRMRGDDIPPRAESEQAAVLLFLLNCYLELPDRWHDNVRDKLRRIDSQRDAGTGVGA